MTNENKFAGSEAAFAAALGVALVRAGHAPDMAATQALREQLNIEAGRILERNRDLAVDAGAQFALQLSSLVLAARNLLVAMIGDEISAKSLLREAIVEPRRAGIVSWLETRMGISADRPAEAFDQAARNFKSGGEATFGASFVYEQELLSATRSNVAIRRCLFNQFFRRNGAAELTELFCSLDALWADELNGGPYNVRFERPTLLSAGDDRCRFHFTRVDS